MKENESMHRSKRQRWIRECGPWQPQLNIALTGALLCCAALIALYLLWLLRSKYDAAQIALSALSLGLFCAAILRTVAPLEKAWALRALSPREESAAADPAQDGGTARKLGFAVLALAIVFNLFVVMLAFGKSGNYNLAASLDDYWRGMNIDATHYLDIAKGWYRNTADDLRFNIVFFPLYPAFIRALCNLGVPSVFAASAVSGVFTALSCTLLYKLARLDMDRDAALRAVKCLLLFPASFFLFAPMSESVFLFFALDAFYMMRKRYWPVAALCALLAATARSVGVILMAPMIVELVAQRRNEIAQGRRPAKASWLLYGYALAPLLGLGLYLLLNQSVYGDPFAFVKFQKEHWSQQITYFWNTPAYQVEYLRGWIAGFDIKSAIGLMGVGIAVHYAALGLLAGGAGRLEASYMAYALPYFAMTMGPQWLLSAPRYTLCLFPLYFILARRAKDSLADTALTALLGFLAAFLLYMFLVGYFVF